LDAGELLGGPDTEPDEGEPSLEPSGAAPPPPDPPVVAPAPAPPPHQQCKALMLAHSGCLVSALTLWKTKEELLSTGVGTSRPPAESIMPAGRLAPRQGPKGRGGSPSQDRGDQRRI